MKISTSTVSITFLVYCFISGCDSSSSNNMDTTTISAANNGSDTNDIIDSPIPPTGAPRMPEETSAYS